MKWAALPGMVSSFSRVVCAVLLQLSAEYCPCLSDGDRLLGVNRWVTHHRIPYYSCIHHIHLPDPLNFLVTADPQDVVMKNSSMAMSLIILLDCNSLCYRGMQKKLNALREAHTYYAGVCTSTGPLWHCSCYGPLHTDGDYFEWHLSSFSKDDPELPINCQLNVIYLDHNQSMHFFRVYMRVINRGMGIPSAINIEHICIVVTSPFKNKVNFLLINSMMDLSFSFSK